MLLMQLCLIGPFVAVALWSSKASTAIWCGGILTLVSFGFTAPFGVISGLGLCVAGSVAAIFFAASRRIRIGVIAIGTALAVSPMFYSAGKRAMDASRLRSDYAYVSLQDRMTAIADPVLIVGQSETQSFDDHQSPSRRGRVYAIQAVHRSAVYHFLDAPEFGVVRMSYPRLWELKEPDGAPIKIPLKSEYHLVSTTLDSHTDLESPGSSKPTLLTPAISKEMDGGHRQFSRWFLSPDRFGDVKDVAQVSGFLPHAITDKTLPFASGRQQEQLDRPFNPRQTDQESDDQSRLTLKKLQMVGLLYHDTPVVYDLETLPELLTADTAPTRPLDSFESRALEVLVAGDPVHIENVPGGVRMLGALRNAESCTECHDGPTNQLLGAFSYELALK
jgi:hypothetical protein